MTDKHLLSTHNGKQVQVPHTKIKRVLPLPSSNSHSSWEASIRKKYFNNYIFQNVCGY